MLFQDERAKPNELSLILANGVYADKAIEIFTLLVEKGANINTRNEVLYLSNFSIACK